VIFLEDEPATFFHNWHQSSDFGLCLFDVVPQHRVQPTVQNEFVPVGLLEMNWIHARFHFKRIQCVKTHVDQLRYERVNVSTRMQVCDDAFLVRPIDGALLNRFKNLSIHIDGEKRPVAVSHIVRPKNRVKSVSLVPNHVQNLKTAVQFRVEDVLH